MNTYIKALYRKFIFTNYSSTNLIIRLMVGLVFLSEGFQKYILPDLVGAGRFLKLGVPNPEFMGPFVGIVEVVCGLMVLFGFLSRVAALPLLIIILNAIYFTKIPTLLEEGFWITAHEGRTDFCMLLGLIFLLIFGSGRWSIDIKIVSIIKLTADFKKPEKNSNPNPI